MTRSRAGRRGFTVLEAAVAAALLAVLLLIAMQVMATSADHVADGAIRADLRARAHQAAVALRRELRPAERASLLLGGAEAGEFRAAGTDRHGGRYTACRFRPLVGFDGATGQRELGPTAELLVEYEAGESSDGADDDGDGLVDEARLVLRRDGVVVATLAEGLLGSAVSFELPDATGKPSPRTSVGADPVEFLRVTLVLQQRGRRPGQVERHVEELLVGLRN